MTYMDYTDTFQEDEMKKNTRRVRNQYGYGNMGDIIVNKYKWGLIKFNMIMYGITGLIIGSIIYISLNEEQINILKELFTKIFIEIPNILININIFLLVFIIYKIWTIYYSANYGYVEVDKKEIEKFEYGLINSLQIKTITNNLEMLNLMRGKNKETEDLLKRLIRKYEISLRNDLKILV